MSKQAKAKPAPVKGFVVGLIHDGTDVAILDATSKDHPDEIWATHDEAVTAVREMSKELGVRWFDMSEGATS